MNIAHFGKTLSSAAFGLAIGLAAGAVAASEQGRAAPQTAAQTRSVSVSYAAGDLATEDGRANLYARIRQAAENVCGPTDLRRAGGLSIASHNRKCYEAAVQEAVSRVETRQLVSLAD